MLIPKPSQVSFPGYVTFCQPALPTSPCRWLPNLFLNVPSTTHPFQHKAPQGSPGAPAELPPARCSRSTLWWLETSSLLLPSSSASFTFSSCRASSCWDLWAAASLSASLWAHREHRYHRNGRGEGKPGERGGFTAWKNTSGSRGWGIGNSSDNPGDTGTGRTLRLHKAFPLQWFR